MKFTYTKGWFRAHKRPLAIWDDKKARQEHDAGRPYTVLAGADAEKPKAFLEVNLSRNFVGVNFLDDHLRPYLEYKFVKEGDRFFLQQSIQRIYNGASENVIRSETYNFTPDGDVTIYENDVEANETVTKEAVKKIDVSKNWEAAPEFGHYEGFAKIER